MLRARPAVKGPAVLCWRDQNCSSCSSGSADGGAGRGAVGRSRGAFGAAGALGGACEGGARGRACGCGGNSGTHSASWGLAGSQMIKPGPGVAPEGRGDTINARTAIANPRTEGRRPFLSRKDPETDSPMMPLAMARREKAMAVLIRESSWARRAHPRENRPKLKAHHAAPLRGCARRTEAGAELLGRCQVARGA